MANIIGVSRLGEVGELKKALEDFYINKCSKEELENVAKSLRAKLWALQKGLDFVCVNDVSFCDNILDLAYALNAKPNRFKHLDDIESYFAMTRGYKEDVACEEMKWLNTNCYFMPELSEGDVYRANATKIVTQYNEARSLGYNPKISLIGLFTFFVLSKREGSELAIFKGIKSAYLDLIDELVAMLGKGVVIEFSEPIFVKGIDGMLDLLFCKYERSTLECIYDEIAKKGVRAILTTFFGHSKEFTEILINTKVYGIGLDFLHGEKNLESLEAIAKSGKTLYVGLIDGSSRVENIESKLDLLEKISSVVSRDKIVISSCSPLSVPFDKENKEESIGEIEESYPLNFLQEKINELTLLEKTFKTGC